MHAKRPSIRGGKGPVSSGPTIPETRNKKTASSSLDEDDEDDEDILSSKRRGGGATNAQAEEDDVAVADDEDEGEGAAEDDVDDDDEEEVGRRSLADDDEDDDDDEAQEDEEDEENENHGLPRERIEDLGYEEAMMKNKAERANPRLGKMEALSEEDLRVIREKKEAEAAALRPVIPGATCPTPYPYQQYALLIDPHQLSACSPVCSTPVLL